MTAGGALSAHGPVVMEKNARLNSPQPDPAQPVDRLRAYLRQLPTGAQALLIREFERAVERGENLAVANLVLGELRKGTTAAAAGNEKGHTEDLATLAFESLQPFLIDGDDGKIGRIRRSSLEAVWIWLGQKAPEAVKSCAGEIAAARGEAPSEVDRIVRRFQLDLCQTLAANSSRGKDDARGVGRTGPVSAAEDIPAITAALMHREALETFGNRLPRIVHNFGDSQIQSAKGLLEQLSSLQKPEVLPLSLSVIMQRLTSPWQIIRLAIAFAGSDEEARIAGTPYGLATLMALRDLAGLVGELRTDIRCGQFDDCGHRLKSLHDGLRGLRTELDIRPDSQWGRQLAAIRIDVSNSLKSEIESVPGRVRRLLRQRPDKDINAGAKLDLAEIDETVALIDFVAVCRNYASELAVNEVTQRASTDLQHYVETATETLVESLRTSEGRIRAFRQTQAEVAIRFSESIFGHDYAALMSKAADVALSGDRKPSKAG